MIGEMQVSLVDHMGSDLSVVNAARVSFHKESSWDIVGQIEHVCEESRSYEYEDVKAIKPGDAKLIAFLAREKHELPFAHATISLRIKAPIFVARQLGKHQVGLVWNEVSRRYVSSEAEFYSPEVWRAKAENVKQGSSVEEVVENLGYRGFCRANIHEAYQGILDHAFDLYNNMIEEGVCPEQARMVLPQSMMTEWIWTGSLLAFARTCNLRLDSHTQKETQEVAQMISDIVGPLYPVSWAALINERN